jgi:1-acyl-sn-glycerol-3-phosphate acyltransferase
MQKIAAYPLSIIYYLFSGIVLLIFHPIQWVCLNWFGYDAHKKSVDALIFFLIASTYVLGTKYKIKNPHKLPTRVPLIIAANHQSWYDIVSLGWFIRKAHPKLISKIELGKGIPSISYYLNHGGSVLIDRKNAKQSLTAIKEMAQYIETNKRSTVIFPEGTRSKTGKPKPFAENGLKILCKYAPSSCIVPVTINNSWKITRWGAFPLSIGNTIELIVHETIPVTDMPFSEVFNNTEQSIIQAII